MAGRKAQDDNLTNVRGWTKVGRDVGGHGTAEHS
jgi:hypothetical protein